MSSLNVLYNTDNRFLDITMASMLSVLTNGGITKITFHIITSNFSKEDYLKLESLYYKYPAIQIYYYDLEKSSILSYNINAWRGSQIANARLFFKSILGNRINDIGTLLYLDSDTIVCNALTDLENLKGVFMSRDLGLMNYDKDALGITGNYYNSGVIYIDIPYWQENHCEEKLKKFITNNDVSKLTHPDQDIINIALNKDLQELPFIYNLPFYFTYFNDLEKRLFWHNNRSVTYEEIKYLSITPIILHAYGAFGITPWTNNKVNPYNEEFRKYLYQVNQAFSLQELSLLKSIIGHNDYLFKSALILRGYISEPANNILKRVLV